MTGGNVPIRGELSRLGRATGSQTLRESSSTVFRRFHDSDYCLSNAWRVKAAEKGKRLRICYTTANALFAGTPGARLSDKGLGSWPSSAAISTFCTNGYGNNERPSQGRGRRCRDGLNKPEFGAAAAAKRAKLRCGSLGHIGECDWLWVPAPMRPGEVPSC